MEQVNVDPAELLPLWDSILSGERVTTTVGGLKWTCSGTEVTVSRLVNGEPVDFEQQHLAQIQEAIKKSTGRSWASQSSASAHILRYVLVPSYKHEGPAPKESPYLKVAVTPRQKFARVMCVRKDLQTCEVELDEYVERFNISYRQGLCIECGKQFLSRVEDYAHQEPREYHQVQPRRKVQDRGKEKQPPRNPGLFSDSGDE